MCYGMNCPYENRNGECRGERDWEKLDAACQEEDKTWCCCGGIELEEDEKCPVCGEGYDD